MAGKDKTKPGELMVCRNPKATQRYVIDEHLEAGMQLTGSEVKSLRNKKADLEGAYAGITNGELFVHKMYIGPYAQATSFAHETKRSRKLLAHRSEIERWTGKLAVRGYTVVPVQVYFKNGRAKIELGLAKAKDMEDKREDIKRKVELREAKDAMGKGRAARGRGR